MDALRLDEADLTLDKQILLEVIRKKLWRLSRGVSWQPRCKSASSEFAKVLSVA